MTQTSATDSLNEAMSIYHQYEERSELEDVVLIRHQGSLKILAAEEVEALYDSGATYSIVQMDEDGNIEEYEV